MKIKYLKLRIDFKYATKGRFYRILLVRDDINLAALGELIVTIFGGTMEHMFLYKTKDKSYIHTAWLDGYHDENDEPYENKIIKDLPDTFSFIYDTGEGWNFTCKKYKKEIIKDIDTNEENIPTAFVLEGKGMGIWEDNISSLYAYLNDEIDKDFNEEDEERGIHKPWNFDIDKYSEFDNPIDINELNDIAMEFKPLMDIDEIV